MPTSPSDGRGQHKWRRGRGGKSTKRNRRLPSPSSSDEDMETENDVVEPDNDEDLHPTKPTTNPKFTKTPQPQPPQPQPQPQPRAAPARVVGPGPQGGERVTDFQGVVKHVMSRMPVGIGSSNLLLENVSYGQLQVTSAVPSDNVVENESGVVSVVVSPPSVLEGKGVVKRFWNRTHVVPHHADWFQPTTVHRLERQVVPQYFSGKSAEHTPEKYMDCRNMIVAKYMENPDKRLLLGDCQGLPVGVHNEDLTRVFRFLDHWGIINYCASALDLESLSIDSNLREDVTGEVHVPSTKLKSIDSLIKFDKPKCKLKPRDVYTSSSSYSDDHEDLDSRIREHLSENCCNYCSRPLLVVYYQSTKEADTSLCSECYHEGRYVVGHSSIDFSKVDSAKECGDQDGETWTDQETLLLLEGLEKYNDNWNEIAEHVGTKTKAQCILHFLRLPMEDGLLEKVEVPTISSMPNGLHNNDSERSHLYTNGVVSGPHIHDSDSDSKFPFANTGNPVMHLVAFLASSLGPRVAAACAHASLAALSEDDGSAQSDRMDSDDVPMEARSSSQAKEENVTSSVPAEKVKLAAKAGLGAAAVKGKLFADHEEREIQRLSANIINHQLKRLELKLKQFAEVETLLMKECEQVEKTRQRLAAERARAIASRFGSGGVSGGVATSMNLAGVSPQAVNNNISSNRPSIMSASSSQPSIPGYPNQISQPQMPFIARPQMFSFGPRLPLSAIQPNSSGPSSSAMFGTQGTGQSSLSHPMLRPVPGTSSGMG